MKQVIISSDIDNLKMLFEGKRQEYCYVPADLNLSRVEDLLKEHGCKKIDIYEGLNGIDFRKEYIDFIGRLNKRYNSIYWLANSISYKGTFVSNLYREIYNYYCIVSLIEKQKNNVIIISQNSILNNCLKKYCMQNNINCRIFGEERKHVFIVHARKCLLSSIYFLYDGWKRKILAWLYLSGKVKSYIKKDKPYYIIKSWVDKRSFKDKTKYSEVFFGKLPEYLKEKDKRFFVLGGIFNDYKEMCGKIKDTKEPMVIPQEYFVGYSDYLKVGILALINRPKIDKPVIFSGLDVTDFLTGCLHKDYENNEINKNLIYYYYIKGLLKGIKLDTFIFTFESHAWEKMSILAMRKYSPLTKIIGYAHSSVRQSMLAYFYSKDEEDVVPLPDKIVTIGKEPRLILEMSGNYTSKVKITDGPALRYEYLFKKGMIKRNVNGKILAAFSIDMDCSLELLKFLCDSLKGVDRYSVMLRSHPFTPVELIMKKFNIALPDNFSISNKLRFEEDLADAAALIYVDTTSSIEALMCGIPAIYVDFNEPVNPDPLFKMNSLKWTVSDRKAMLEAIGSIYGMDDEEYRKQHTSAMVYLKNYFYPVEEKYMKEFIR